METSQNLDFMEFQKAITPQVLLIGRIIYTAMLAGAGFFLAIVLVMSYSQERSTENAGLSGNFFTILAVAHAVFLPCCYLVAFIVFRYQTNPVNLHKMKSSFSKSPTGQDSTAEQSYLNAILAAYLFRTASFEAPAIFGMVICLVAGLHGYIQQHPAYWLNLFSFVVMAGMMIHTFPTRTKLEDLFKKRCIVKPPHVC